MSAQTSGRRTTTRSILKRASANRNPTRKPFKISAHLLALQHRFVQYMSPARVDIELHGLPQSLQRAIKLPGSANGHPRIPLAVLNQQRRRYSLNERSEEHTSELQSLTNLV